MWKRDWNQGREVEGLNEIYVNRRRELCRRRSERAQRTVIGIMVGGVKAVMLLGSKTRPDKEGTDKQGECEP